MVTDINSRNPVSLSKLIVSGAAVNAPKLVLIAARYGIAFRVCPDTPQSKAPLASVNATK